MRALLTATALSLLTIAALAASPEVESALKVFQALRTDPTRLKAFCEVMQIEQENSGRENPLLEAKLDKLLDELGADFKAALETAEHVEPASEDGKILDAALDQLSDECPGRT
jgi:hypothetical protein